MGNACVLYCGACVCISGGDDCGPVMLCVCCCTVMLLLGLLYGVLACFDVAECVSETVSALDFVGVC